MPESKPGYSPEEVMKFIADGVAVLVVCALATNPPRTDHYLGQSCVLCKASLQITPRGLAHVTAGALTLCNPCGVIAAELKKEQGRLVDVELSEETKAAMARGNTVILPERLRALVGERIKERQK